MVSDPVPPWSCLQLKIQLKGWVTKGFYWQTFFLEASTKCVCVWFCKGPATHANLRIPTSLTFKPHEGRLAASSQENITAAQQNKLSISLPWLTEKLQSPEKDGHPLTGSSDHYVLYDKFHEGNTRDPQEVLRRINMVPEFQGSLNSQVAEQLFSSMQKNNYYLHNMVPSTHIFFMRNIIHHRNNNTNARLMEQQLKRGCESHQW